MGRRKLNSELISNERSRMITFHKRKKGLIKKVEEFQILCNVKVCVIIFSPKLNHHHRCEVETWPSDPDEVKSIIYKYRENGPNVRSKKNQDLSDYFVTRKNKVDHEIAKVRKAIREAKFSKRCDQLNLLSYDQLWELERAIDAKLGVAERRLLQMKSSGFYSGPDIPGSSVINPNSSAYFMLQNNMDYEFLHGKQPVTSTEPLDMVMPGSNSYDLRTQHTRIAVDESYMENPMLRLIMDGEDYTRFSGVTNNNLSLVPLNDYSYYNSNSYASMVESSSVFNNPGLSLVPLNDYSYYNSNSYASMVESSSVFNNPGTGPEIYYRSTMQPTLPYMEIPSILNASSQLHNSGICNLHQLNDFDMNDKKLMF
ncbi:hypothetical protein K2173_005149 [Erythroxylum novogranatense]|uniref:MADS-box domain-containing protein n=1 Tax=Erythroxylum novogranatense TaxID=1862640 RepID=A0AAV8TST8_9ROSI|nr:hypothetical protein K2173_005149 [Erythroxylum novogranatense]